MESMMAADLTEIVEANREVEFTRLQVFAAKLSNQSRGFTESESERRFVIRFVIRQRGVAGNRGAIFGFENQRLVPKTVGKQPKVLAPDAELLPQHGRRQRRDLPERCRTQC